MIHNHSSKYLLLSNEFAVTYFQKANSFCGKNSANSELIIICLIFADVDASAELKFQCPLCQEKFGSQEALEAHAFSVHSVNAEGLQRLQSLISGSHWLNKNQDAASTSSDKGMFLFNYFAFQKHARIWLTVFRCITSIEDK